MPKASWSYFVLHGSSENHTANSVAASSTQQAALTAQRQSASTLLQVPNAGERLKCDDITPLFSLPRVTAR